jgi:hypothetical protein
MASLSELANVMSTSPAQAFRQEDTAYQQYQLQQQSIQQAQQDQAQQAKGLGGMTGLAQQGGKPAAGLGQMAGNSLSPDYKLTTPDGDLTTSGLYSKTISTAQAEAQQSQKALQDANYYKAMGKTAEAQQAEMEARRLQTSAKNTEITAQKIKTDGKDDLMSSLYRAKSQTDYDQRLKDALERTGVPLPKEFPTSWSPDLRDKFIAKMSPVMRQKMETEDRAEDASKRAEYASKIAEQRLIIADRREGRIEERERKQLQGLGATSFLEKSIGTSAKDEKVNQGIVDTALGVSQMDEVINKFKDPEVKTGVVGKLAGIQSKLASLGDDNKEITPEDFKRIVDGEISPTAKNAVAQKEALFAAYTAEREIAGGRLLVSVIRQAGGALDPTAYEKEGYLNLLSGRRNELLKRLRGKGLNNQQIDTVVKDINQPNTPVEKSFEKQSKPQVVKVGGTEYSRPPNFTDKQWEDYQKAVGAPQ